MELGGDPEGVKALKALHAKNKDYIKFLIGEARSNVDQTATFSAEDGKSHWVLKFDAATGNLDVQPAPPK